jgi:hypothetical protein
MPRTRLHKSSIVIGLIFLALLALIMIPRRIVRGEPSSWMTFEHGWPFTYLRRETEGTASAPPFVMYRPWHAEVYERPMLGIPWLAADNWRFWEASINAAVVGHESAHWEFKLQWLLIDLAAAAVLLPLIIAAWEVRRRRRPSVIAFGLADVLVATTAISLFFGYCVYLKNEFEREDRFIETALDRSIHEASRDSWSMQGDVCVAPTWISALFGEKFLPDYMWRASSVEIYFGDGNDLDEVCNEISTLKYATEVWVSNTTQKPFQYSALRNLNQFETLVLWNEHPLSDRDVNEILPLKHLKKIVIDDLEQNDPAVLSRLETALPDCKTVDFFQAW